VYPPNVSWVDENGIDRSPEENTKGRFVPLTGAVGKAEDFEFKTFVNNSTKRVSTLRRKKGSKQFFDLSSGRPVTDQELSGMTDISGETAYESMTKAEAKGRRRDMLNKAVQGRLQEQFRGFDDAQIESWVDANQGAGLLLIEDLTERAAARQVQIDNLKKIRDGVATTEAGGLSDAIKQSIDIAQAIKKGTGGYAKVKSILNRIASTGANLIIQPFGGKPVSFGRDEELAREYVRSFAILFRIAAANSPRFAEGEQGRLALLLPDVEKLLTSPQFELDKLRIFKQNLQAENIFIKKKLAYASDLSSSVISNLENAEQAIELALGMMPDVIPPGVRPSSGMSQQQRQELMRLQEEGSQ
jgi:hypothetical protein